MDLRYSQSLTLSLPTYLSVVVLLHRVFSPLRNYVPSNLILCIQQYLALVKENLHYIEVNMKVIFKIFETFSPLNISKPTSCLMNHSTFTQQWRKRTLKLQNWCRPCRRGFKKEKKNEQNVSLSWLGADMEKVWTQGHCMQKFLRIVEIFRL